MAHRRIFEYPTTALEIHASIAYSVYNAKQPSCVALKSLKF